MLILVPETLRPVTEDNPGRTVDERAAHVTVSSELAVFAGVVRGAGKQETPAIFATGRAVEIPIDDRTDRQLQIANMDQK
jgi:F420-0:gamma-glutamyl ligase